MKLLNISYFLRLMGGLLLGAVVEAEVCAEGLRTREGRVSAVSAVVGNGAQALTLGFSKACFAHVSHEDALLATKLLERHFQESSGRSVRISDHEVIGSEVSAGQASVVILTAAEYIAARSSLKNYLPVSMSVARGAGDHGGSVWVLMAREENALPRGKDLGIAEGDQGQLARWWLQAGSPSGRVLASSKASLWEEPDAVVALLRVYFGVRHACLVPEWAFVQASVKNPALARGLVRVAETPPLPGTVLGVRLGDDLRENEDVCEWVRRLHSSTQGRAVAGLLGWQGFSAFNVTLYAPLEKILPASSRASVGTHTSP